MKEFGKMKKIQQLISIGLGERYLTKKYTVKGMVYKLLILFTLSYLSWECYWYSRVGLACIKWHSHVMLFLIPLYSIVLYFDWRNKRPNKGVAIVLLLLFALFISETSLMFSDAIKTIDEKELGYNVFSKQSNHLKYYHIDPPNEYKLISSEEFNVERHTNSLGYSDYEVLPKDSADSVVRVLCLGDSFTEGDGASFEESYVSQMRMRYLKSPEYYVFNAGKCGSDPFFNFVNYRDILSKYKFDIIIQTIHSNDVETDYEIRGGLERFENYYTLGEKQNLEFSDYISYISYVGRIFVNFKNILHLNSNQDYVSSFNYLFKSYYDLIEANGAKLVLVAFPNKHEIESGYSSKFSEVLANLKQDSRYVIVDLLPYYKELFEENRVGFINEFWWVKDGHHNAKGYLMMAQGIYYGLEKANVINSKIQ